LSRNVYWSLVKITGMHNIRVSIGLLWDALAGDD